MKPTGIVVSLFAIVHLTGCARNPLSERLKAVKEFSDQMAARRKSNAASMQLFREGMTARDGGDLPRASALFREAVTVHSGNSCAWMALGEVAYRQDQLVEAAKAFHEAARLEPDRWEPRFNLGTVLEYAGLYDKAVREYQVALELSPGQLEVMENLARCYVRSNSCHSEARKLVDQALISEHRPEWREWLAMQAMLLGQQESADEPVP